MLKVTFQNLKTGSLFNSLYKHALNLAHHGLALIGLLVLCTAALWVARPELKAHWKSIALRHIAAEPSASDAPTSTAPATNMHQLLGLDQNAVSATVQTPDLTPTPMLANPNAQAAITRYLSRKYRVSADAVDLLVSAAYLIGQETKLDPNLLLAVMAVESGFNPFAESVMGAQGLMQVMSKVHRDKLDDFGGTHAALNPVTNIKVGALILKDCIRRGGSLADGLRLYVGSSDADDGGYSTKVLQEKERIQLAARNAQMQTASLGKSDLSIPALAFSETRHSQAQNQNNSL